MIRAISFAILAAFLAVNAVRAQSPPTITSTPAPRPSTDDLDWLDIDSIFYSLVPPLEGDDEGIQDYPAEDCYSNWCFPAGMFVDLVVNHCNSTLTNLQPNKLPQNPRELEAIVGECICGIGGPTVGNSAPSRDVFLSIAQMWKTCASCLNGSTGVKDPKHASILSPAKFARACACVDPGPVQALINMQNSAWECTKVDQDRLRSARRAGSGLPVRRPTASTSVSALPSATPSAQPSASPAPGNAAPARPQPVVSPAPSIAPAPERVGAAGFDGINFGDAFSPFGAARNP